MAKTRKLLKVRGSVEAFTSLVKIASQFCSSQSGAPAYHKSILLQGTKRGLKAVGASETQAIELSDPSIEVLSEGTIMVLANWLNVTLGTMQPGSTVELEEQESSIQIVTKDDKGEQLNEYSLDIEPLDLERHRYPDVGDFDSSSGIEANPEQFVDSFRIVATSSDPNSNKAILQGVHAEVEEAGDGHKLRFLASDMRTTTTHTLPVEVKGDGFSSALLDSITTQNVLNFLSEGDKVELYKDDQERIHALVHARGVEKYHIRIAALYTTASEYPKLHLIKKIKEFVKHTSGTLTIDKMELLHLLDNAASMASLDVDQSGGMSRIFNVDIADEKVRVRVLGKARYDDATPVMSWASDHDITFQFHYGVYSQFLRMYPGNERMNIAVVELQSRGSEEVTPRMLLMFSPDAESVEDEEKLSDYFSIVQIANGSHL